MGRVTQALCHWQGRSAEAHLELDSQHLVLRGGHKARLARSEITAVDVTDAGLTVRTGSSELLITLDPQQAARWATALNKPPPTLAAKLGLDKGRLALVLGTIEDAALQDALEGRTTGADEASVIVAIILSDADLRAAFRTAQSLPSLALWCVYGRGPAARPGDTAIREYLRGSDYIDTKSCAVSERLTATRYHRHS